MSEIRLVDRDYKVFQEIERWRICLGRHIKELAGFDGQRACDRRLRKLIDTGFIERKKILYGVPGIYTNTHKAKKLASLPIKNEKKRVEQIPHDIIVLDAALYFQSKHKIPFGDMTTEKQLHTQDGFGIRKHRPDFVFTKNGKNTAMEIELTLKAKRRIEANLQSNFMDYDSQIWIVPDRKSKIAQIVLQNISKYPNLEILDVKEVTNHE